MQAEAAVKEPVEQDLDELLAKAQAERDEYLALAQRTQADFENYRKRMGREVGAAENRGIAKVVKEILPALDNLELRAAGRRRRRGRGGLQARPQRVPGRARARGHRAATRPRASRSTRPCTRP